MALNVKIDLSNKYETVTLDKDLNSAFFDTELIDGSIVRLGIQINSEVHPLMPNVYNLAFGPVGEDDKIDDRAKLTHQNHSKVFSTIVFEGFSFLSQNRDKFLGIDGSNNARAYMYYRCIQKNYDYLTSVFLIYGVNYYVRILRRKEDSTYSFDTEDIVAIPKQVLAGEPMVHEKLYNYFIFNSTLTSQVESLRLILILLCSCRLFICCMISFLDVPFLG